MSKTKNQPKIEQVSVESLIPYARNSRTHSDEQIAQLASSIREFGWTNPILIDGEQGIIAGHGRLMAARKLGMTEVPCIRLDHLTDAQRRAYIIADNKLALNAGWDEEMLALELGELGDLDFDLSLIGFDESELGNLMAETTEGETDPDEVPEPPVDPVTVLGDLWVMGKHRLACGDCTDQGTVDKALNGVKPHLMVTDPPYGVEYDAGWRDKAAGRTGKTGTATGKVLNDDRADWRDAWALFPGEVAYIWHAMNTQYAVAESIIASDFEVRAEIVWAKSSLVMSRGHYHPQHESCFYAVRKGGTGHWAGDRKQTTLWKIDKPQKSETGHSTQKPVECMKRPIENNSSPGQAVYEPFSGSGTTIIAGEMTGRCVHAIELNPSYVDVAVTRWQAFTGKQAIHEASGKTFDEMKAAKPQSQDA
jgi:DNA modification methylase